MFVQVKNVSKQYRKKETLLRSSRVDILRNISFEIQKGESLGLIGESGGGKSTLSRFILGLDEPTEGKILMEGIPLREWARQNPGRMSVVFQDYHASVNPGYKVKEIIAEPLLVLGELGVNIDMEVSSLLERVGLSNEFKDRYPHELSGGQLQRVCIARAVAAKPAFIVLDEAISSLDVSVQAEILNLLYSLQKERGMTYLFIGHDLQAVTSICHRVILLHQGEIVENLYCDKLYEAQSDYAKKLLASVMPL